jgi:peptidoglycan/LPS O-acetylase OafA/YrhL
LLYLSTWSRLDALVAAAAIAAYGSTRPLENLRNLAVWRVVSTLLVMACIRYVAGGVRSDNSVVQLLGYTTLALLSGALVVLFVTDHHGGLCYKIGTHRLLATLGKCSYALCVFHFPLVRVARLVVAIAGIPSVFGSDVHPATATFVLTLLVAGVASLVIWNLIEARLNGLKRLFA